MFCFNPRPEEKPSSPKSSWKHVMKTLRSKLRACKSLGHDHYEEDPYYLGQKAQRNLLSVEGDASKALLVLVPSVVSTTTSQVKHINIIEATHHDHDRRDDDDNEDEEVDARAEEFIRRFRHSLNLKKEVEEFNTLISDEVDARAEDFIQHFRQRLKVER